MQGHCSVTTSSSYATTPSPQRACAVHRYPCMRNEHQCDTNNYIQRKSSSKHPTTTSTSAKHIALALARYKIFKPWQTLPKTTDQWRCSCGVTTTKSCDLKRHWGSSCKHVDPHDPRRTTYFCKCFHGDKRQAREGQEKFVGYFTRVSSFRRHKKACTAT